ncbi:magnesium chelatase subunit D [Methylobacterium sp. Leaf85]|uniref:magnesium chelatase subunit D n=1 Tax=Methylobacterium sp. Leaf85 TaxID=1736241 RepID=UPI0006F75BC3|nr:magnesium chelatase subunit D [Methylobacterium sp. Leaf85]KQO42299.1 magnesium chelatase ATPase subunit D [Methylobacterium sp. Leaf85]
MSETSAIWADALLVARLVAADPHGCGGVVLRAGAGPVRDRWLEILRENLNPGKPLRRMPAGIAEDRLVGGLDLAATLSAGRPVAQAGLLAEAHGGLLVAAMAERMGQGTAAHLAAALDTGRLRVERDGLAETRPARFGLVLLDEGIGEDEAAPAALADRLAFHLDLTSVPPSAMRPVLRPPCDGLSPESDKPPHGGGRSDHDPVAELSEVAARLGIDSLRAPLLALRVARLLARLDGRAEITEADVREAARLVLGHRATRLPERESSPEEEEREEGAPETPPPPDGAAPGPDPEEGTASTPDDRIVEAARAAIPAGLLALLLRDGPRLRMPRAGKAGAKAVSARSGRPMGARPGDPRRGRLDLIATLRAAAPWQGIRRRAEGGGTCLMIRPDDIRITRFRQRTETTTIFTVDASGSSALERLAEAKGAVELLLAEAYTRRDKVALVAFRGAGAELVLAPTRSLVRARRGLAALPGGGGTPLAAGIDAAGQVALGVRRGGGTPVVVMLTDGRANVARSGIAGRERAGEDSLKAARLFREADVRAILIDTAPRPQESARRLAAAMGARYLPLPHADAGAMSAAIRSARG